MHEGAGAPSSLRSGLRFAGPGFRFANAVCEPPAAQSAAFGIRSGGVCDLRWVMEHTAILHFCGKEKPWKPKYIHRFGILYQHYMQLSRRETAET